MQSPENNFEDDYSYWPFSEGKGTSIEDAIIIDAEKTPWLVVT